MDLQTHIHQLPDIHPQFGDSEDHFDLQPCNSGDSIHVLPHNDVLGPIHLQVADASRISARNKEDHQSHRQSIEPRISRVSVSVDRYLDTLESQPKVSLAQTMRAVSKDNGLAATGGFKSARLNGFNLSVVQQLNSSKQTKGHGNYKDFQKEMYQQKSQLLEDQLYQTKIALRKKEGEYVIKVAVLEQQVTQLQTELEEAQKRESSQKSMYSKALRLIKEQFENNDIDSDAFFLSLSNVQTIINEVNQDMALSPIKAGHNKKLSSISTTRELFPKAESTTAINKDLMSQIQSLTALNVDLSTDVHTSLSINHGLKDTNKQLEAKLMEAENQIQAIKDRETKLKNLHSDEQKFTAEIQETQNQLFLSQINDLKATISHLQTKIKRCETNEVSQADVSSCLGGEIGGALTAAGAVLGGSTSRLHSSALKREAHRRRSQHMSVTPQKFGFDADRSLNISIQQTEVRAPEIINSVTKEGNNFLELLNQNKALQEQLVEMEKERVVEMEYWEGKKNFLEQTVSKIKKIMNFNLSNHKEATDRLKLQVKEAEVRCLQKDEENKQLQNKLTTIKVQISKLEKVQMKELSRSRSGQRLEKDAFKFHSHRNHNQGSALEKQARDLGSQGEQSVDSQLRIQAKSRLYGESYMQKVTESLTLKNQADKYNTQRAAFHQRNVSDQARRSQNVGNQNYQGLTLNMNELKEDGPRLQTCRSQQGVSFQKLKPEKLPVLQSPITSLSIANQRHIRGQNLRYNTNQQVKPHIIRKLHQSQPYLLECLSDHSVDPEASKAPDRIQTNNSRSRSRHLKKYLSNMVEKRQISNLKENSTNVIIQKTVAKQDQNQIGSFANDLTNNPVAYNKPPGTMNPATAHNSSNKQPDFSLRDGRMFNTLYQSIQCSGSPDQFKLERSARLDDEENQSCSNVDKKDKRYFGDVALQNKLISNLAAEAMMVPSEFQLNYFVQNLQSESALKMKHMTKATEKAQGNTRKFAVEGKAALRKQDREHEPSNQSSMTISPVKQEASKARINDNLRDASNHSESKQLDQHQNLYDLPKSETTRSRGSSDSKPEELDVSLEVERDAFLAKLEKQRSMALNQNALTIIQNSIVSSNNNRVSDPYYVTTAAPSIQQNPQPNQLIRLEELNNKIVLKLKNVFNRLIARDKKLRLVKHDHQNTSELIAHLQERNKILTDQLSQYEEQKQDLLIANQKFEYRLKQAQFILNDQNMKNDLEIVKTQQNSIFQQAHGHESLGSPVRFDADEPAIGQSLSDLHHHGSAIRQMEHMRSMQKMLSARSRDGSVETFNSKRSPCYDFTNERALTLEDDQVMLTFQCQESAPPQTTKNADTNKKSNILKPPMTNKNTVVPRLDVHKVANFRNTVIETDYESKLSLKPKESYHRKNESSLGNGNRMIKGSAGFLPKGRPQPVSTLAQKGAATSRQSKNAPSKLKVARSPNAAEAPSRIYKTQNTKSKKDIGAAKASKVVNVEFLAKQGPLTVEQVLNETSISKNESAPRLTVDFVSAASQDWEVINHDNTLPHTSKNASTARVIPKTSKQSMLSPQAHLVLREQAQNKSSDPKRTGLCHTGVIPKKTKASRNTDLNGQTFNQLAAQLHSTLQDTFPQTSFFNVENVSLEMAKMTNTPSQRTPKNTAQMPYEENTGGSSDHLHDDKLIAALIANKSGGRYKDADCNQLNLTLSGRPSYQVGQSRGVSNLSLTQTAVDGPQHSRRKSEESDENLVNLFGSQNTPYAAKALDHRRLPTASEAEEQRDEMLLLSKNVQNLIAKRNRNVALKPEVTPEKLQSKVYTQTQVKVSMQPFPYSSLVTVNENDNQESMSQHSLPQRKAAPKNKTAHFNENIAPQNRLKNQSTRKY